MKPVEHHTKQHPFQTEDFRVPESGDAVAEGGGGCVGACYECLFVWRRRLHSAPGVGGGIEKWVE
jgi:hypothetical protein